MCEFPTPVKRELMCICPPPKKNHRYLDEVYAVKDEVEAAKKELEQVKSEKLQLLERCRQAEDSVRALTLRVQVYLIYY